MRQDGIGRTDADAGRDTADGTGTQATPSEELHIRNYDPFSGYDLTVVVADGSGERVLEETFYFQPGGIRTVEDTLPAGEYRVTVTLDGHHTKTATCRIGPAPEHTAHIELGNGTVSVTEGLY